VECANPLGGPALVRELAPTAENPIAERRHLTVLFCDLAGSTAIAGQLDPEEWGETLAGYQRAAAEAITRFGGYVAKYLGDGVMALFGYPEAHDNDAERAARAGLAIVTAIAKLNEQPGHAKLSARVGIDSGAVVVEASTGRQIDVFGEAPSGIAHWLLFDFSHPLFVVGVLIVAGVIAASLASRLELVRCRTATKPLGRSQINPVCRT
jgi:class 3 adenylate cyclase